MRICHFTSSGPEFDFFRDLTLGLADRGHSVLLGTLNRHPAPSWTEDPPQVQHFSLNVHTRVLYPRAVLKLAALLRRNRVDVCHAHLFDGAAVGLTASLLSRTPARVMTRHHLDEHQLLEKPAHVRLDGLMARGSHCTVVPSEAARLHMIEVERLSSAPIRVIPIGRNLASLRAAAEERMRVRDDLGLASDFIIGYTGRLVPNKGLAYLFDAIPRLAKASPSLRLLLVGEMTTWARHAIREHGISERVIAAGYRDDAPACIAAMDVAVHPSLSDSLAQVVIEALGVGTPVVATRVGGIPEIVSDGVNGVLVPPRDSGALADAIAKLRDDPSLRRDMIAAGADTVRQRFGAETMVDRHVELYEELAA